MKNKSIINIAFFASHNGSNAKAIINKINTGNLKANPALIISNNSNSEILKFAQKEEIPSFHISSVQYPNPDDLDNRILELLEFHKIDLLVLAGYMKKIGGIILEKYKNRILNIHPSLLPKYGGEGMYGMNVHNAVFDAKETETGVTIHYVNSEYDKGEILMQEKVKIEFEDTVESIRDKVLQLEHQLYPRAIEYYINKIYNE